MPKTEAVCVTKQMVLDRAVVRGQRLTEEEAAQVLRDIQASITQETEVTTMFVDEHIQFYLRRATS